MRRFASCSALRSSGRPSSSARSTRRWPCYARTRRTQRERHGARNSRTGLARLELQLENLAATAANRGAVPAVIDLLNRTDAERQQLADELVALERTTPALVTLDPRSLRRQLRGYVDEWQTMAAGNVAETRDLLSTVLRNRIAFAPVAGEDAPRCIG